MSFGESAIDAVDWASVEVLSGTGSDLAQALVSLLRSRDQDEAQSAWWRIENVAFAQDTVYGAAEPTIDVALAALGDDRPQLVRSWLVELLFFLLKGGSLDDPTLPARCRSRARPGIWLLAREARTTSGADRELVLSVIGMIDAGFVDVVKRGLAEAT